MNGLSENPSLGGDSNEEGFCISVAYKRGSGNAIFTVKSRGYAEGILKSFSLKKKAKFHVEKLSLFLSPAIFLFFLYFNHTALTNMGLWMFPVTALLAYLCVFGVLILVVLATEQFFFKKTNQWHACEHKAVNMLLYCDEVTMENLKKESRHHSDCGTTDCEYRFGPAIFLFFCSFHYLVNFDNARLVFLLYLIILWSLFTATRGGFAFFLQYCFMTRKPTEEQLKETLRVAKIVREKMKEVGQKK